MPEQITSIKDLRVVAARALTSAAGRSRAGQVLLEGAAAIGWALDAGACLEHVFYHGVIREDPLLARLAGVGVPCYAASDGILKKISDTSYLVPFLGVAPLPADAPGLAGLGA